MSYTGSGGGGDELCITIGGDEGGWPECADFLGTGGALFFFVTPALDGVFCVVFRALFAGSLSFSFVTRVDGDGGGDTRAAAARVDVVRVHFGAICNTISSFKFDLVLVDILSGFKACSLYPFQPDIILDRFSNPEAERPSSSESSRSVLIAEDWRKVSKILRAVVDDVYNSKAQQLSQTIHSLSTQNILLKLEVQGLKKVLVNEKKWQQRGKVLQLELPPNQDGGAIFWSPNKVQIAPRAERLQKQEDIQRRAIEKAEKQQALEERRRMKATTKKIRLQEQARRQQEKEDSRHDRLAAAQLQKDIQSAKQAQKARKQ
ncbi:uncharacterized protein EI97DRAFT_500601 [Westerdykella ornata]|uniref:Uncharacterized protein n=1 Tax=Westerdykella ornata TaxID=318751 RepID=A0A6A6JLE2_WESOR|nr:uncharacterized protein EI97DRAFT_500601 [Westerdykella ornata]KAF2276933.1 hypothetical protein EI97DRAFT_500601 [Westerdykella ornata]